MQIDCPHCGQKTTLRRLPTAPPASAPGPAPATPPPLPQTAASPLPPPPPAMAPAPSLAPTSVRTTPSPARSSPRRKIVIISAAAVAVVAIGVGGTLAFLHGRKASARGEADPNRPQAAASDKRKRPARSDKARLDAAGDARVSPAPTGADPSSGQTAAASARDASPSSPKSVSQLLTGGVSLEKAAGSSLVYAVGALTNASSHQRYDVNVYVALTDAGGKPAGTARDQRSALEPREVWRFRALVLDSRARAGAITNITEEP